jgi:hypothetical protein
VKKERFHVAQIIPLGFVTASNTALTANVPAPSGFPLRCNKVLIQASRPRTPAIRLCRIEGLNKTTGAGVIAVLQAGQSAVVGDERDSNVLDPTALAVDSVSGARW